MRCLFVRENLGVQQSENFSFGLANDAVGVALCRRSIEGPEQYAGYMIRR